MRVLVCGAQGFIGRHLLARLLLDGHEVVAGHGRVGHLSGALPPGVRSCQIDFAHELEPRHWRPRLQEVDAVINAVGVLRDSPQRPMDAVHEHAPAALFEACAQAGVRRVLHISALGIAESGTHYARSKRAAEVQLLALATAGRLDATLLRPSIVFGPGGASSELFLKLARLPALLLPGAALRTRVQPVAVADLAEACARLLTPGGPRSLAVVGPQPLSLADFIACLRQQLGRRPARVWRLPEGLSRLSARLGDQLPFQPWGSETLALLQQPNCADVAPLHALLGREPIAPQRLLEAS